MISSDVANFRKYRLKKQFNSKPPEIKLDTTHKMIMSYLNNSNMKFEVHSWNIIFEHFKLSYAIDKQDQTFSVIVENRNFDEIAIYDMPYGLWGLFEFIGFMELISGR